MKPVIALAVVAIVIFAFVVWDADRERQFQLEMLAKGQCRVYVPPHGWQPGRYEYQPCAK